jgi:hypothetical protein
VLITTEVINDKITYNVIKYTPLLADVCDSVTEPFGYSLDLDLSLRIIATEYLLTP